MQLMYMLINKQQQQPLPIPSLLEQVEMDTDAIFATGDSFCRRLRKFFSLQKQQLHIIQQRHARPSHIIQNDSLLSFGIWIPYLIQNQHEQESNANYRTYIVRAQRLMQLKSVKKLFNQLLVVCQECQYIHVSPRKSRSLFVDNLPSSGKYTLAWSACCRNRQYIWTITDMKGNFDSLFFYHRRKESTIIIASDAIQPSISGSPVTTLDASGAGTSNVVQISISSGFVRFAACSMDFMPLLSESKRVYLLWIFSNSCSRPYWLLGA
eukprot:TRINITY_DN14266_c0_g1_i10.p1 TRINITY_DN14266_c0_g1~~TRINITY_DN14266_c0_g1_i10.p1  ORF type:complete len:266 (-),score=-25.66 TRINITY_DN14266_c0_g1_i10:143-940(-)